MVKHQLNFAKKNIAVLVLLLLASLRDPSRCAARRALRARGGPSGPRRPSGRPPCPTYSQWGYRPIASPARGRYATPRYLRRQTESIVHPSINHSFFYYMIYPLYIVKILT